MLKLRRVGDPQLSPDGRWVAYQITGPDVPANRSRTQLYLVSVGRRRAAAVDERRAVPPPRPAGRPTASGSPTRRAGRSTSSTLSNWQSKQVTNISTGAGDPVWSPDGRDDRLHLRHLSRLRDDDCNRRARRGGRGEARSRRRWPTGCSTATGTTWKDGKRTHVFVVPADGGAARDLTPGDYDAPPFSLGGPTDYAFSPDSKELAFARNTDKVEATSTNNDIFIVPVTGGEARRITDDNRGSDQSPQYSPDGRFIAYRSQQRAGFEADRWRLMLYDRQANTSRELIAELRRQRRELHLLARRRR